MRVIWLSYGSFWDWDCFCESQRKCVEWGFLLLSFSFGRFLYIFECSLGVVGIGQRTTHMVS